MKSSVKRRFALFSLIFILMLCVFTGCTNESQTVNKEEAKQTEQGKNQVREDSGTDKSKAKSQIDETGTYTSKDDVARYIHRYKKLPDNFITKKEARNLGWEGGSLEAFAKGKCIGGDRFGNYEKKLPTNKKYKECDIDTLGAKSRGAKRIIFSEDADIYYTEDHYETFIKLDMEGN